MEEIIRALRNAGGQQARPASQPASPPPQLYNTGIPLQQDFGKLQVWIRRTAWLRLKRGAAVGWGGEALVWKRNDVDSTKPFGGCKSPAHASNQQ